MGLWKKYLETATNFAVLCTCVLIGYVAVTRFVLPQANRQNETLAVGTKLKVTSIDWSQHDQTLVLALSTQCHFCSQSAEFYRRAVSAADGKQTHIIAVLPQATVDSRLYLEQLGVNVTDIRQLPLETVGVKATPTVLLVDNNGVIAKAWVGKLPASNEAEVLAQVR